MSAQRRVFPESFKREAVDRVANSGLTAGAVARELGLHETVLRRWMTQFGVQATGQNGLGTTRRSPTQASSPSPSDFGRRGCPATAGERAASDGAGHPKKAALIFGAASR